MSRLLPYRRKDLVSARPRRGRRGARIGRSVGSPVLERGSARAEVATAAGCTIAEEERLPLMSYTIPYAGRQWMVLAVGAVLTLLLAACGSVASSSSNPSLISSPSSAPSPSQVPAASQVAVLRCASTPDATPSVTIEWNDPVKVGDVTIKAGQAVAFVTQIIFGPTVTEGTDGIKAADYCIDKTLSANVPGVVTFYQPGDYHIFCRKAPTTMLTVVHVQ
jgi:plastocyanin